jgi:hypothetical protein
MPYQHTSEELAADTRAQEICAQITHANWMRPDLVPCEICGENHENWNCCDQCNYQTHTCHFCGDDLGHAEVSACVIEADRDEAWEKANADGVVAP